MDDQAITVWTVFKRFLIGWTATAVFLVVISCVKYKEFIFTVFTNNTWAWINVVMPVIIVSFGIIYMLKSAFN